MAARRLIPNRRLAVLALVAVTTAVAVSGTAGAFTGSGQSTGWQPIGPTGNGMEIGISCLAASNCMAVGLNLSTPGEDAGVTHVVGSRVAGWGAADAADAVACRPHWCVVGGDDDLTRATAQIWDGHRWSAPKQVGPTAPTAPDTESDVELGSISCPAIGVCYGVFSAVSVKTTKRCYSDLTAAGCTSEIDSIEELRDGSWQPLSGAPTFDGSDDGDGDGVAAGSLSRALAGRASSGATLTQSAIAGGIGPISCAAVGHCVLPDSTEVKGRTRLLAYVLAHGQWTTEPIGTLRQGVDGELKSISCWSPSRCVATGLADTDQSTRPLVAVDDGGLWTVRRLPLAGAERSGGLDSVSCTRLGRCLAVGGGEVAKDHVAPLSLMWFNGVWRQVSTPSLLHYGQHAALLLGVSCPTIHSCTAVGDDVTSSSIRWYIDNYRM